MDEIADDLQRLSEEMNRIANRMMDFCDDDSCIEKILWKNHAQEMIGAAFMARDWAKSIYKED